MGAERGAALLAVAKTGESRAVSALLTWIDRASVGEALSLPQLSQPDRSAFRLGITGPPGAGKSTLVACLISGLRRAGLRVGVLAVDPTSPFSRGAILGDRIRYADHALDSGVFIRSLGTRGSLGGLSSAAFLMSRAMDVCGFDVVLIETVGVGQTELDVVHVADRVCVVLVPESGDAVQAMKAGLMEIGDVYMVNKADRPGADALVREVQEAQVGRNASAKVFKCVATEGRGVEELLSLVLEERRSGAFAKLRLRPERLREEARALLRRECEHIIEKQVSGILTLKDFSELFVSQIEN